MRIVREAVDTLIMVFLWENRNDIIVLSTKFTGINPPSIYFFHVHLCHLREVIEAKVGTGVSVRRFSNLRSADVRLSIIRNAIGFTTMRGTIFSISAVRRSEF